VAAVFNDALTSVIVNAYGMRNVVFAKPVVKHDVSSDAASIKASVLAPVDKSARSTLDNELPEPLASNVLLVKVAVLAPIILDIDIFLVEAGHVISTIGTTSQDAVVVRAHKAVIFLFTISLL